MNIDLRRFVDINIEPHIQSVVSGTRNTVALYTAEGSAGTSKLITSLAQATTEYSEMADTLAYLQMYFANGGAYAYVIEGISYSDITADMLKQLDNTYICVAYAASVSTKENAYNQLKTLAQTRESDPTIYGINEKLILASSSQTSDTSEVKNFIAKYSSAQGAEMTIAAYLSQIDVYGTDTIFDYAFTQETIIGEDINDETYGTLIGNNYNVDIMLANYVRNCGGNCKDGQDIVNTFVRIVLHQTLTDRLIQLLAQKLKGTNGVSKIYTTITQELERYLTCGYLTTDKIWSDDTLSISYNAQSYQIIEKGTALTNGYIVRVLPITSLTTADRLAHKAPLIYVVIADQYSIRMITINGEVI